ERLIGLIDRCDAAIALPGGAGTLAEIAMLWNRLIVEAIPARPLVLVGDSWKQVMGVFFEAMDTYILEQDRLQLKFCATTGAAFDYLQSFWSQVGQ
ncbi:MAG: hypothetical protein GYA17_06465, partial [Chloroflexi bacterium]|nr:hypothetical protein [Chloroflexota bacterium]